MTDAQANQTPLEQLGAVLARIQQISERVETQRSAPGPADRQARIDAERWVSEPEHDAETDAQRFDRIMGDHTAWR